MAVKFLNYKSGYRVASLALDESTKTKLVESRLSTLYVGQTDIILYPEQVVLSSDSSLIQSLQEFNNYDVFEIWENGIAIRRYNDGSGDNYFFITGACNSNCIMCPSPENSRKNAEPVSMDYLMALARHIPSDTPHLTITGGEPFLIGDSIFPFIKSLKEKFCNTDFLFLTNGRIFAVDRYLELFKENMPAHSIVAIPIHGSCAEIHDAISRAKNSFQQTKAGIKKLLKNNVPVEIRLVVSKLNVDDFENIAELIATEFSGVEYISVIAMEMTGNARVNCDKVWIPYSEAFSRIAPSIRKLIKSGIDVKLYNFPLCTVDSAYWTLCEKSISDNKVRYADTCEFCKYKKNCGGVFAGTFQMEKDELRAIL